MSARASPEGQRSSEPTLSAPVLIVRIAVSLSVIGFLQLGPVSKQLLGLGTPMFGMAWTMYSGTGRDLCSVRWLDARSEPPAVLDRREILALGPAWASAPEDRFLRSADEVRTAASALCAALGEADVRARAQCPAPDGRWRVVVAPQERLCPER